MKKKKYPTYKEAAEKVVEDCMLALARKKLKAEIKSIDDDQNKGYRQKIYELCGLVHVTAKSTVIVEKNICLTLVVSYTMDGGQRKVDCAATLAVFKNNLLFTPIDSIEFWLPPTTDMKKVPKSVLTHLLNTKMPVALEARKAMNKVLREFKGSEITSVQLRTMPEIP